MNKNLKSVIRTNIIPFLMQIPSITLGFIRLSKGDNFIGCVLLGIVGSASLLILSLAIITFNDKEKNDELKIYNEKLYGR